MSYIFELILDRVFFREREPFVVLLLRVPSSSDGNGLGKFYGQAERAISTGQLRALLHFHLPPIKVVVFDRSS